MTVPDVRLQEREDSYMLSIAMCVAWLAIFSFIMTECLETLGELVGISPIV